MEHRYVLASDLRSVKRVTVTEVVMLRGAGTEEDSMREVTMFFDDDGRCLAEHDPVHPTPWYAPEARCVSDRLAKLAGTGYGS